MSRRVGPVLLVTVVTVLATACGTHTVTGTPQAAPSVPTAARPPLTTTTPTPAAEALAWTRATDQQTGTSAELPGPATVTETTIPNPRRPSPATTVPIRIHQVQTSRSGTVQLAVLPRLPGGIFDFDGDVETNRATVSGTVVSKEPVTVDGHRGIDYAISYLSTEGKPSIVYGRVVETRGFAARVTTRAVNKDMAVVAAVHERVRTTLRVPAA